MFQRLFKREITLDSVLAGFNDTVAKLRLIAETETRKAAEAHDRIFELRADAEASDSRAARASHVADKIDELIR